MRGASENNGSTQPTSTSLATKNLNLSERLQRLDEQRRMHLAQLQYSRDNRMADGSTTSNKGYTLSDYIDYTPYYYQSRDPTTPSNFVPNSPVNQPTYQPGNPNTSTVLQQPSEQNNNMSQRTSQLNTNKEEEETVSLRHQLLIEVLSQIDSKKRNPKVPSRKLNADSGVAFDWGKMPRIGSVHSVHGIVESTPNNTASTKSPPSSEKDSSAEKPVTDMSKMKVSELAKLILGGTFDGLLDTSLDKNDQAMTSNLMTNSNQPSPPSPRVQVHSSQINNIGGSVETPAPTTANTKEQHLDDRQLTVLANTIIGSFNNGTGRANVPLNQTVQTTRNQTFSHYQQPYVGANQSYGRNVMNAGHINTMRNVGIVNQMRNTYVNNVRHVTGVNQLQRPANQLSQGHMTNANQRAAVYQNRMNQAVHQGYLSSANGYQRSVNTLNQSYPFPPNQTAAYRRPVNTNQGRAVSANQAVPANQTLPRDANLNQCLSGRDPLQLVRFLSSNNQTRTARVFPRILSVLSSSSRQVPTSTSVSFNPFDPLKDTNSKNAQSLLDDTHDSITCVDCLLLGTCPIKKSIEASKNRDKNSEDDIIITKVTTKNAEKGPIERIDVDEWAENAPSLPGSVRIKQEPIEEPSIPSEHLEKTNETDSNVSVSSAFQSVSNEQSNVGLDKTIERDGIGRQTNSFELSPEEPPRTALEKTNEHPVTSVQISSHEPSNRTLETTNEIRSNQPAASPIACLFAQVNSLNEVELSPIDETPVIFPVITESHEFDCTKIDKDLPKTVTSNDNTIDGTVFEDSAKDVNVEGSNHVAVMPGMADEHDSTTKHTQETDSVESYVNASKTSITDEQSTMKDLGGSENPTSTITHTVNDYNQGDRVYQEFVSMQNNEAGTSPPGIREGEDGEKENKNDQEQEHRAENAKRKENENESGKVKDNETTVSGVRISEPYSYDEILYKVMQVPDKIALIKLEKSLEENQKRLNRQTVTWIRNHILKARLVILKKIQKLRNTYESVVMARVNKQKLTTEETVLSTNQQQESGTSGNENQVANLSSGDTKGQNNEDQEQATTTESLQQNDGYQDKEPGVNAENEPNTITKPNSVEPLSIKKKEVGVQIVGQEALDVSEQDEPMTLADAIRSLDDIPLPGQEARACAVEINNNTANKTNNESSASGSQNKDACSKEYSSSNNTSSSMINNASDKSFVGDNNNILNFNDNNQSNKHGIDSLSEDVNIDSNKNLCIKNTNNTDRIDTSIKTDFEDTESNEKSQTDPMSPPSSILQVLSPVYERKAQSLTVETSPTSKDVQVTITAKEGISNSSNNISDTELNTENNSSEGNNYNTNTDNTIKDNNDDNKSNPHTNRSNGTNAKLNIMENNSKNNNNCNNNNSSSSSSSSSSNSNINEINSMGNNSCIISNNNCTNSNNNNSTTRTCVDKLLSDQPLQLRTLSNTKLDATLPREPCKNTPTEQRSKSNKKPEKRKSTDKNNSNNKNKNDINKSIDNTKKKTRVDKLSPDQPHQLRTLSNTKLDATLSREPFKNTPTEQRSKNIKQPEKRKSSDKNNGNIKNNSNNYKSIDNSKKKIRVDKLPPDQPRQHRTLSNTKLDATLPRELFKNTLTEQRSKNNKQPEKRKSTDKNNSNNNKSIDNSKKKTLFDKLPPDQPQQHRTLSNTKLDATLPRELFKNTPTEQKSKSNKKPEKRKSTDKNEHEVVKKGKLEGDTEPTSMWERLQMKYTFD